MFGIAAIVLACFAAVGYFAGSIGVSSAGLACVALACLAAHITWPIIPWRKQ